MIDDWKVSIRRACAAIMLDRSTYHYKSSRPDQAALEKRIKEICETRVHYGYRRIHTLLQREGWAVNHKRVRRIYNELGLQLRKTEATAIGPREPKAQTAGESQAERRPPSGGTSA